MASGVSVRGRNRTPDMQAPWFFRRWTHCAGRRMRSGNGPRPYDPVRTDPTVSAAAAFSLAWSNNARAAQEALVDLPTNARAPREQEQGVAASTVRNAHETRQRRHAQYPAVRHRLQRQLPVCVASHPESQAALHNGMQRALLRCPMGCNDWPWATRRYSTGGGMLPSLPRRA